MLSSSLVLLQGSKKEFASLEWSCCDTGLHIYGYLYNILLMETSLFRMNFFLLKNCDQFFFFSPGFCNVLIAPRWIFEVKYYFNTLKLFFKPKFTLQDCFLSLNSNPSRGIINGFVIYTTRRKLIHLRITESTRSDTESYLSDWQVMLDKAPGDSCSIIFTVKICLHHEDD